jgi:hypothetical protein
METTRTVGKTKTVLVSEPLKDGAFLDMIADVDDAGSDQAEPAHQQRKRRSRVAHMAVVPTTEGENDDGAQGKVWAALLFCALIAISPVGLLALLDTLHAWTSGPGNQIVGNVQRVFVLDDSYLASSSSSSSTSTNNSSVNSGAEPILETPAKRKTRRQQVQHSDLAPRGQSTGRSLLSQPNQPRMAQAWQAAPPVVQHIDVQSLDSFSISGSFSDQQREEEEREEGDVAVNNDWRASAQPTARTEGDEDEDDEIVSSLRAARAGKRGSAAGPFQRSHVLDAAYLVDMGLYGGEPEKREEKTKERER